MLSAPSAPAVGADKDPDSEANRMQWTAEVIGEWVRAYGRVERWLWTTAVTVEDDVWEELWEGACLVGERAALLGGAHRVEGLHVGRGHILDRMAKRVGSILRFWVSRIQWNGDIVACWTSSEVTRSGSAATRSGDELPCDGALGHERWRLSDGLGKGGEVVVQSGGQRSSEMGLGVAAGARRAGYQEGTEV